MNPLDALLVLIPAAPFAAGLFSVIAGRTVAARRVLWLAVVGNFVAFASAVAALMLWSNGKLTGAELPAPHVLELFRWLPFPGETRDPVAMGLTFDELTGTIAAAMTLAAAFISAHVAAGSRHDEQEGALAIGLSWTLSAGCMALLAPNFLQFFVFWQLSMVATFLWNGKRAEPIDAALNSRFLVNRATDLFIALALLFVWNNFRTFDFAAILGDTGSGSAKLAEYLKVTDDPALLGHRLATISLICLLLFVGVMGRCGQFPFFGRAHEVGDTRAAIEGLARTAVVLPLGVILLLKTRLLFSYSAETQQLMLLCGCFTGVIAVVCAATETDLKQVLGLVVTALYGWMFMALGNGTDRMAALLLLVVVMLGFTALFLIAGRLERETGGRTLLNELGGLRKMYPVECWGFLLSGLVIASGLWGQNAILATLAGDTAANVQNQPASKVDKAAPPDENAGQVSADPASRVARTLFPVLASASMLLTAFALFRAFFLTFHHDVSRTSVKNSAMKTRSRTKQVSPSVIQPIAVMLPALLAALIGPLLAGTGGVFTSLFSRMLLNWETAPTRELFVVEYGSLLALIGMVAAWTFYSSPSPWPEQLAKPLATMIRLANHRFYLDDVWSLLILVPLRGLTHLCRFIEWSLLESFFGGLPERISKRFEETSRRLETGVVQFYALSVVLVASMLLAVVSWLKG